MNYIAAFMMLVVELHKSPAGEAAQAAEEDAFWLTYALCRRAIAGYHSVDVSPAPPSLLHFCHTCAPAHRSEPAARRRSWRGCGRTCTSSTR